MKKLLIASLIVAASAATPSVFASVLADWTFETTAPTTSGPFSPEVGAGTALGSHTGASVYSTPAGNGSAHSFSSNTWAVGDFYQFQVSTVGASGISIAFDQTGSSTGPQDFKLAYSTNGTTFTDYATYKLNVNGSPNTPWSSSGSPNSFYTYTYNLSSLTSLDNQSTLYFRLIDRDTVSFGGNGGVVAAGGTDRVDNVVISAVAVPEPSTYAAILGGLALVGVAVSRRFPKSS